MSVAPLTLTAHSSLFTGLYPPHHGVRDNADRPLAADKATLAEVLHARGFRTGAFVGLTVLAADCGLARGFDVYDEGAAAGGKAPRRRPANEVIDGALAWLDSAAQLALFRCGCISTTRTRRRPCPTRSAGSTPAIPTPAVLRSPTRSSRRLIDALRAKGVFDSTAIIVAGDHGESLGEHGEIEHGIFLYEGTLHVPMIMRAPGLPARRVTGLASLVDVMPTVLDLFGLEPMAWGRHGPHADRARTRRSARAIDLRRVDVCAAIRLESAARSARRPVQARRCAAARALRP